jgi:hypothetical protein
MDIKAVRSFHAKPLQSPESSASPEALTGEEFTIPEESSNIGVSECATCRNSAPAATPLADSQLVKPADNTPQRAAAAYRRVDELKSSGLLSDMAKYKDDQLLRNPGGDAYDLKGPAVVADLDAHHSFTSRIGKDLSDAWGNCQRFFQNLAFGSELQYRDSSGQIHTTHQKGLLSALGDFFKHSASALTFGLWTPQGETAPSGLRERFLHFLKKTKQAFLNDLIQGLPSGINRMGRNLILAGWNLVEVIPDATVGQFDAGRKLTTTVFDNGQVVVEYLTDVIPSGDAWMRVHSASWRELKAPILFNLSKLEHSVEDTRWEAVRNTPFRKSIETIGALLADAAAMGIIGQTLSGGRKRDQY